MNIPFLNNSFRNINSRFLQPDYVTNQWTRGIFGNNRVRLMILGALSLIVLITVVIIFSVVFQYIRKSGLLNKCILRGIKNGKNSLVIKQRDIRDDRRILRTLDGMNKGLEFTYSVWMNITSLEYPTGSELRPIFYKSMKKKIENSADVSRHSDADFAPGIFLTKSNTLIVMMRTGEGMKSVKVENIPLKKWFHLCLIVRQESMDIYVNGQMVQSKRFPTPPVQNDGDLYINTQGGFDGIIADLKFYAYGISYDRINKLLQDGPSTRNNVCNSRDQPPYFNHKWWLFR